MKLLLLAFVPRAGRLRRQRRGLRHRRILRRRRLRVGGHRRVRAQEIAIRCATGVDGCDGGKTTEHVCVPLDATLGPPCEPELALVCPAGQIDGCLRTPRAAARHICIFQ